MTGPLVSIGLPVRNGEKYLALSIESLLKQTYENIELVICDNLSSDSTRAICEEYAAEDPRVRYHRNDVDVGGSENHNLVFKKSTGKYFRWAAHDDIVEPDLIARCVEVLEARPEVVNCHCDVVHIDEHGDVIETVSRNNVTDERPSARFATVAGADDYLEEIYGVMRSEVLGRTNLHQPYTASDRTLLSEIALYGPFDNVNEVLFRKRLHPGNEYVDWRARMAWFDEKYRGKAVFPWWRQLFDYCKTVLKVDIERPERIRCALYVAKWTVQRSPKLAKDVAIAVAGRLFRNRKPAVENWS